MEPQRLFAFFHGTWENPQWCRNLNLLKQMPIYSSRSASFWKRNEKPREYPKQLWVEEMLCHIKKRWQIFDKNFFTFYVCTVFLNLLLLLIFWINFSFLVFGRKKYQVERRSDFFGLNPSLQPPRVRLRTWKWLPVQFNPRDTISCAIEALLSQVFASYLLNFEAADKKSWSLQTCCPYETQSPPDFIPVNFENVFSKFDNFVILTNTTLESCITLQFETLNWFLSYFHIFRTYWIAENSLNLIGMVEFPAVDFAIGWRGLSLKLWIFEKVAVKIEVFEKAVGELSTGK